MCIFSSFIFVPLLRSQKFWPPRCFQTYDLGPSHKLFFNTNNLAWTSHIPICSNSTLAMFLWRWSSLNIYFCKEAMSSWPRASFGELLNIPTPWTISMVSFTVTWCVHFCLWHVFSLPVLLSLYTYFNLSLLSCCARGNHCLFILFGRISRQIWNKLLIRTQFSL